MQHTITFLGETIEVPDTGFTSEDMTKILTECDAAVHETIEAGGLKESPARTAAIAGLTEALSIVAQCRTHSPFFIKSGLSLGTCSGNALADSISPAHAEKERSRCKIYQMSLYAAPPEYLRHVVVQYIKACIRAEAENRRKPITIAVAPRRKKD